VRRTALGALGLAFGLLVCDVAQADGRCGNGRSRQGAMWLSIAHPGLGEYYLKGWGPWSRVPQKKFWFGFIPFYGWPGYLQVKSADDAFHCRTNDDLSYRPEQTR
jgi:hypothetical protein